MSKRLVLVIDNYDSFVHILADEFQRRQCQTDVFRSHWPVSQALHYIKCKNPDLVVFSPGPGRPEDALLCLNLLAEVPTHLPIFGVCLGLQCIVHHFGGRVVRAREVVHGKPAPIRHCQAEIFEGIESPMQVGRYHSLIGVDIPDDLVVDAESEGQVMAVHHRHRPIWGVQFHPESILTPFGGKLIENLIRLLETRRGVTGPDVHRDQKVKTSKSQNRSFRRFDVSTFRCFDHLFSPQAKLNEQIAFLEALNQRTLSGEELAAMAKVIRARCVRVTGVPPNTIDLCGTGGDCSGTFNVSTIASFVVAGAGIPVAKHGNRSVSSRCGSTDCLEKLGIKTSIGPDQAGRLIRDVGIAFLFAPLFHPAMAQVTRARRALSERGQKTVFNILGPLVNPACVTRQAVGVFREELIEPVVRALKLLGVQRAMVFHGQGLDELTLTGETEYARLENGEISRGVITPEEFGFDRCTLGQISAGTRGAGRTGSAGGWTRCAGGAVENARLARNILEGRITDARRDIVVLNAAVGIQVGSLQALHLKKCIDLAAESIDSGQALAKLTELIRSC